MFNGFYYLTHDLKKVYVKSNNEEIPIVNFQIAVNSHTNKEKNKPLFINCVVFFANKQIIFLNIQKKETVFMY